jgi:hypothetical protein
MIFPLSRDPEFYFLLTLPCAAASRYRFPATRRQRTRSENQKKRRGPLCGPPAWAAGCPFCVRREKHLRDWHFVHLPASNTTQVECRGCGAPGPRYTRVENGDDLVEVLTLWNERSGEGGSLQLRNLLQQRNSGTVQ